MRAVLATRCGCTQTVSVPSPPPPVWMVRLKPTVWDYPELDDLVERIAVTRNRAFDLISKDPDFAYYLEQWPPFEGTHQGDRT